MKRPSFGVDTPAATHARHSANRKSLRAASIPRPGRLHGRYPQRLTASDPWWLVLADTWGDRLRPNTWLPSPRPCSFDQQLQRALATATADPDKLNQLVSEAARVIAREGFSDAAVALAQAATACAVQQVLGYLPYPSQHAAARLLVQGRMVEMETGEGKSLAILLGAATAAMGGVPVHVLTVNDYLARRDADVSRPVLSLLGLSVGAVVRELGPDQRRAVYAGDVTYVTAQEVGFDYLRDRMLDWALPPQRGAHKPVLRGLCMALVDEVDGVLLDHAATPLVLAVPGAPLASDATMHAVYVHSAGLRTGVDFTLDAATRRAEPAPAAVTSLAHRLSYTGLGCKDVREVRNLLLQALVARHLLRRDVHYLVHDGKVVIIDETTGRIRPDSVWSNGLHAMAAIKERQALPPSTHTGGQITLQTLLRRYCLLGGISGTLRDSRAQLWLLYALTVRRVAPRVPSRGQSMGVRVYVDRSRQHAAIVQVIRQMRGAGRAVLLGTDSVETAELLSQHLDSSGIVHERLTARDDAREAELVAGAGQPGAVMVSTNLAGRGTHIPLHPDVEAAGGLHVVCCALNSSPRIDRQLFGRAARNGQPGSYEALFCLKDTLFVSYIPEVGLKAIVRWFDNQGKLPAFVGRALARAVQACSVWNRFYRSWQSLSLARRSRDTLLRLPNLE